MEESSGSINSSTALINKSPKVHLHLHIEGSLRLKLLKELCVERKLTFDGEKECVTDATSLEDIRTHFTLKTVPTHSLASFLSLFGLLKKVLDTPSAIEWMAFECVQTAVEEGVVLLEARYAPQYLVNDTMDLEVVHRAVRDGINTARETFKGRIHVGLICILDRSSTPELAMVLFDTIVSKYREDFVGVDLAADEAHCGLPFKEFFKKSRELGLGVTIHAGEAGPPSNIRDAILELGATRIGHGIAIVQDVEVAQLAKERGVLMEVCPISNYCTSTVPSYEEHPINKMKGTGLKVSISTDDPGIFNCNLNMEYDWLERKHGWTKEDFKKTNLDALEASFLPDHVKREIREKFFM